VRHFFLQTVILENAQNPNASGFVEGFEGDGYVSLAIVYAVSALADLFAPSIMAVLGMKVAICGASLVYASFIATFFALKEWLLYVGSGLMGWGSAIIWITQGCLLSYNSDEDTITRNTSIFYTFFQISGLLGNTFTYFQFKDSYEIEPETRGMFLMVLLIVVCCGSLVFAMLLPMPWVSSLSKKAPDTPWTGLKRCLALFFTLDMLLLAPFFAYVALAYSFWTGVYGPSLAFAAALSDDVNSGNNYELTGLHGIIVHMSALITGVFLGILGDQIMKKVGRCPIVILGVVIQFTAIILVLLNVPLDAPLGETTDKALALVPSSRKVALTCSSLMGIAQGCFETQVLGFVSIVYADRATQGFAVYKVSKRHYHDFSLMRCRSFSIFRWGAPLPMRANYPLSGKQQ